MTAAVAAVSVGADAAVIVILGLVIALMTTGTIRLVSWETPGNHLSIARVALATTWIAAMIAVLYGASNAV